MIKIYPATDLSYWPLTIKGVTVERCIQMVKIEPLSELRLSYAGDNEAQIAHLRKIGVFDLPPQICSPADIFHNTGVKPADWFFHDIGRLLDGERSKFGDKKFVTSNAGNAPGHEWEVNFSREQKLPLACRDHEADPVLFSKRRYSCVTYGAKGGLGIGYVKFNERGEPEDPDLQTAVGGKPLVHNGEAVDLAEFLETSVSDLRHTLTFPEIDLGKNCFMPLGNRTIQRMIREGGSAELIRKVRFGEPIEIDLAAEKECWGKTRVTERQILDALSLFGYADKEYEFAGDKLKIRYTLNYYRHTFWATRGDTLIIGIIKNSLPMNDGKIDHVLYSRILKPTGLTIPELQGFLVGELHADQAVMLGSGKDCQYYVKENGAPVLTCDNDVVRERPFITAGLISVYA